MQKCITEMTEIDRRPKDLNLEFFSNFRHTQLIKKWLIYDFLKKLDHFFFNILNIL